MASKVFEPTVGPPCPICNKERIYKTPTGLRVAIRDNKPCRSCANSISGGGKGDVKRRGCFNCGNKLVYSSSLCLECHNARSRKYHKDVYRWRKYGLDGPIQMDCCEICDKDDDLVIDHCHSTGNFRGVLCRQCNSALGLLQEDKNIINKASAYATRTFNEH